MTHFMILNDFVLDQFYKTSVYTSFQLLFLCVSVLYIFKHPDTSGCLCVPPWAYDSSHIFFLGLPSHKRPFSQMAAQKACGHNILKPLNGFHSNLKRVVLWGILDDLINFLEEFIKDGRQHFEKLPPKSLSMRYLMNGWLDHIKV